MYGHRDRSKRPLPACATPHVSLLTV